MTDIKPTPGRAPRRGCLILALLILLPALMGGCFTPGDYDAVVTLPDGEMDDPVPPARKKGAAMSDTGLGLDILVDWVREETELGESFSMTVYLVADSMVGCSPDKVGTFVINDAVYNFTPDNVPVDFNDPSLWRVIVTTATIYVDKGLPLHVLVTWPMDTTYHDKEIGDLTVEFDA